MLLLVLIQINLYICFGSATSIPHNQIRRQQHVRSTQTNTIIGHFQMPPSPPSSTPRSTSLITTSITSQLIDGSSGRALDSNGFIKRENKMDSIFNYDGQINEQNNDKINYSLTKQNDNNLLSSLDYGLINMPNADSNSLDNSLEEAEMFTNNHQLSINDNNSNSRHYNSYQVGSSNSIVNQFGKFVPNQSNSNKFANNFNLNYIHSLLTKPSATNSVNSPISSVMNTNSNSLTLTSTPVGLSQNGFSSSYTSASSALSNAVNKLQQTLANKQHQLAQMMTISNQEPQQQQQQQNLTTIADFPGSSTCGRQQIGYREPRIVGGNNTYEGEFPWAVSIQRHGNHHCGGVIVGRRWILTAAHCVRSQLVGNLVVRTGGHTLTRLSNNINSHLERDYLVEQVVMHDDFSRYDNLTASQMKSSANTNNADIALLKLKHEIRWNELAWPVCFPNKEAGNFSGHDAIVIGWGKLNEKSEDFSNELQKVKLTIIDNKVCQNWFRQAGRDMPIDDRVICAGFKNGGKDACHGDSGGPLLSRINGQYVVVGVVSTGIGCARPLLPGLYSRVSSYIGWIEKYVAN